VIPQDEVPSEVCSSAVRRRRSTCTGGSGTPRVTSAPFAEAASISQRVPPLLVRVTCSARRQRQTTPTLPPTRSAPPQRTPGAPCGPASH
jgi:hypothetical protein